jgi:hypothetical protein
MLRDLVVQVRMVRVLFLGGRVLVVEIRMVRVLCVEVRNLRVPVARAWIETVLAVAVCSDSCKFCL